MGARETRGRFPYDLQIVAEIVRGDGCTDTEFTRWQQGLIEVDTPLAGATGAD